MKILYQFAILMSLIVVIIIFSACTSPFKGKVDESSFTSHYDYKIGIQVSAPIYDITLYLPIPIQNGTPKIGTLNIKGMTFIKNPPDKSYIYGSLPPNFDAVIEDVHGVPYLKITADAMLQDQAYNFDFGEVIHTPAYAFLVNTRYPIRNESLLQPKYNLSGYVQFPATLNYTTLVYTDYRMDGDGMVSIDNSVSGSNSWYLTSDAWISNNYADWISLQLYGNQTGWHMVEGKMIVGNGVYLD
jgi:hypothetical protein